ncbi:hypothetical protein BU24DRAFT_396607 [Aaosphaeria arxii CBS 175.79]|uniref:Transcriptional coactivator p15 (PC4) C-terminal domain-containing protein n=1 Tax=Aaosphaeria arxii CBS 175.79 TaxID=1450172 RepID=A0A6A5XGF2_9PLEO|nr:uncharacterized protein BU24DRAFT_396607 [Aaosphaeria arxii CBS 175.79]KAF2011939.1 hypothetical protein BU24DRAFT_396607 [Aaosphaeria arxii CBS 175.79]
MSGRFKSRGGRGGTRGGGFKSARTFSKKRASPEDSDNEDAVPASKKSKGDEESEPLVPTLQKDGNGDSYVALKSNEMRRVTVSNFKGSTLVQIRDYFKGDGDQVLPGKKGIALTLDQYNVLVQALPLIESVLKDMGQETVRPDFDGSVEPATNEAGKEEVTEQEEEEEK